MKHLFTFVILVSSIGLASSQNCSPELDEINRIENDYRQSSIEALSNMSLNINSVDQFFDGDGTTELFDLGFAKGIWAGALDPAGNLKIAASGYNSQAADFAPGPIIEEYQNDPSFCAFFTRVWSITETEIIELKSQFQSGMLDLSNIPLDILEWPARGNPHIEDFNISDGLASFFDADGNGMYDPMVGDYPIALDDNPDFLPSAFRFYVFNDRTLHEESQGDPLDMEFQITDYVVDCEFLSESESTIFTRLKFFNKGNTDLRDFKLGIWDDTDLGCFQDDAIGCNQSLNTSYYYNEFGTDFQGSCSGLQAIPEEYGAVRSLILLNKELESFIYFYNCGVIDPAPQQCDPQIDIQYYNLLNAQWLDGSELTEGGNGFNPNSTELTAFAFPDFPTQSDGWSMISAGVPASDTRTISVFDLEDVLLPGQGDIVDFADHVLISKEKTGLDIFDIYESAITEIKVDFEDMKEGDFNCDIMSAVNELDDSNAFIIYPNPSNDVLQFDFHESQKEGKIFIHSMEGREVGIYEIHHKQKMNLSITNLAPGMYMLTLRTSSGEVYNESFVKM